MRNQRFATIRMFSLIAVMAVGGVFALPVASAFAVSGAACYEPADCSPGEVCSGAYNDDEGVPIQGVCSGGGGGDVTVPELPEILLPAFMIGAAALAHRSRKRAMARRNKAKRDDAV